MFLTREKPGVASPAKASAVDAFTFVLAGLAPLAATCDTLDEAVRDRLQNIAALNVAASQPLLHAFAAYLGRPIAADAALANLALHFLLDPLETLAVRLCIAAEQDLLTGHLLTHLQQPLALSRPTIGLLAQAFSPTQLDRAVHLLGQGNAVRCGLLQLCGEEAPLPERQLRIPLPTAFALQLLSAGASSWPGVSPITLDAYPIALGPTSEARAEALARRLSQHPSHLNSHTPAIVLRCADPVEARAAVLHLCRHLDKQPVLIQTRHTPGEPAPGDTAHLAGLAPWLILNDFIPVFSQWLTPGDRRALPAVPGFTGPVVVLSGPEGDFDSSNDDGRTILDWRIGTPATAERAALWQNALGSTDPDAEGLAQRLAQDHRHAAGRIALLASRAREEAAVALPPSPVTHTHIRAVSRRGDAVGLGALAELIPDEVDDSALVVAPALREELDSLVLRCRLREHFPDNLGASIQARYRPSVRALFVGPSGTGKTLAVAWLAARLGIPLFRVDLSAITSKYIGETEKNLSQLLARAEQSEVLLLFDEADSLFGKRTDIQDSNDRFANAQTNYLLQRMESYDGITILTSNGRSRFDDAFSRRFDAILTFPLPGAEERRELWLAHLGPAHGIPNAQLNLLAAVAELSGGQIRNAVLRAAVAAAQTSRDSPTQAFTAPILFPHLLTGVATEYRKLSRQLPNELKLASAPNGSV